MKKIFAFTSEQGCGCTFLEWSANFLAGQTAYYSSDLDQTFDLTLNPLTQNNAHAHKINKPNGYKQTLKTLEKFNNTDLDLFSFYPTTLRIDEACAQLGINQTELQKESVLNEVNQYINADYARLIDHVLDQEIDLCYVSLDKKMLGYHWTKRNFPARPMFEDLVVNNEHSLIENHESVFFNSSSQHWVDQGLNNIWDIRERMALDNRPFQWAGSIFSGSAKRHLYLNCQEVWFDCERSMRTIQDFLQLSINQTRAEQWKPIAQRWQQIQLDSLKFWIQLDHIVCAIVNDYDYPLPCLTLRQESIIQHCLIYQHNLNLRTWQLEKFPNNARLLHCLLETNIHPVNLY